MPRIIAPLAARLILLLVISLPLVIPRPATAQEPGPLEQVKAYIEGTIKVLTDPGLKGEDKAEVRRQKVWDIITPAFADKLMVSLVLGGKTWKKLTPEQQAEIIHLFSELMKRSYIGKLESYSGEPINYDRERAEGDDYLVETTVIRGAERIPINYRVTKVDGKWRLYDVIVSGSSLVGTQRSAFGTIIRREGYEALVKRLKAKLAEEEALEKAGQAGDSAG